MKKFRLSRGRALTSLIGDSDRLESAAGAPGFAAIVVRKDTGYPGGGYFCDDELPESLRRPRSRSTDPHLSESEKDFIRRRQLEIWKHYGSLRSSSGDRGSHRPVR